ncbi:MAG TPA: cupin domain-containing protein [Acetobacteraceae bacterium]
MRDGPINLTEIAAGMSWKDACDTLRVCHRSPSAGVSIQPLDDGANEQPSDSTSDTIYVVISGYGILRYEDTDIECTAGDVLFVPRGHPHRFARMDGEIRIWRIRLL